MEQLVATLASWPGVVLIMVVVGMLIFRAPITDLIQRTKRVGKTGIETYEAQPSQPGEEKKAIDEFLRTFDNPLVLEGEQAILKDLKDRKIESVADREKALVRSLAATYAMLHFERAYNVIWASQFNLLHFFNTQSNGADVADIVAFYETGKKAFPAYYVTYSFDQWLGFLQSYNLIEKKNSRIFIMVAGREFLKYLVGLGKPAPAHG